MIVVVSNRHLIVAFGVLCCIVEDVGLTIGLNIGLNVSLNVVLGVVGVRVGEMNQFELIGCEPCCVAPCLEIGLS